MKRHANPMTRFLVRTCIVLAAGLMLFVTPARSSEATHGHSHEKAERHHGEVEMTRAHHFESTWSPDGLRLYLYTAAQAPMNVKGATGSVTFRMSDGSSKEVALVREAPAEGEEPTVYFCPMHPDVVQMKPGICTQCGTMKLFIQDRLFAPMDLRAVKPGEVKGFVKVTGLKGDEAEASFVSSFTAMTPRAASMDSDEHPAKDEHPTRGGEHGGSHEGHGHH